MTHYTHIFTLFRGLWWSKDRKKRFDLIIDYFAKEDNRVDFITLQEVWCKSDYEKLTAGLAHLYPYNVRFVRGVIGSGLVILSKHPITHSFFRKFTLNGSPDRFWHGDFYSGKGVGGIRVKIKRDSTSESAGDDIICDVFSVHLHAEYSKDMKTYEAHRLTQLSELAQFVESVTRPSHVVLVGGDLNTLTEEMPFRLVFQAGCANYLEQPMLDSWTQLHGKEAAGAIEGHTFARPENVYGRGKKRGGRRLDYILYNARNGMSCVEAKVIEEPIQLQQPQKKVSLSDHAIIHAKFQIEDTSITNVEAAPSTMNEDEKIALVKEAIQVLERKKVHVKRWQVFHLWVAFIMALIFVGITIATAVTIPNDQLTPILILALFGIQPAVVVTIFLSLAMARLFLQEEKTAINHFIEEWKLWLWHREVVETDPSIRDENSVIVQIQ